MVFDMIQQHIDYTEIPAFNYLKNMGLEISLHFYEYKDRGGTLDAAQKLGIDEHQIIKSLVFQGNGSGVMALMHGDGRVSVRKLERASGMRRLWPASPEKAELLTSYKPGGICPFGISLPVFVQKTLLDCDSLYINAGIRGVVAQIGKEALCLEGFHISDIMSS